MTETLDESGTTKRSPNTWPTMRAIVKERNRQAFMEQRWRPGCSRCGTISTRNLTPLGAKLWREKHVCAEAA